MCNCTDSDILPLWYHSLCKNTLSLCYYNQDSDTTPGKHLSVHYYYGGYTYISVHDCIYGTIDTMKRSSLNNEEISLRSNCAYESRDQISKKVLDLKAASVTQMTTEIIIKPNDSYEPHKAWIGN